MIHCWLLRERHHVLVTRTYTTQSRLARTAAVWCGLLAIVVLSASECAAQTPQITADRLLRSSVGPGPTVSHEIVEKAIHLFQTGKYEEAYHKLEEAQKQNPKMSPAAVILARMYYLSRQQRAAHSALELAVKTWPNDPEAYLLLGEASFGSGSYTAADLLFQKSLVLARKLAENPRREKEIAWRGWNGVSMVAAKREDWKTAQLAVAEQLKLVPNNPTALRKMGKVLFELKQDGDAYKFYEKAQEIDKNLPDANVSLARLYEARDNHDRAMIFIKLAVNNKDANRATVGEVIQLLAESEELEVARDYLIAIEDRFSDDAEILYFRGLISRGLGKINEAIEYFRAANKRGLALFDPPNHLAQLLAESGQPEKQKQALRVAETNLRDFPRNPQAKITLAWVYYQQGQEAQVRRTLKQIPAQVRLDSSGSYQLAEMLYYLGKAKLAKQLLEAAPEDKHKLFFYRKEAEQLLERVKSAPTQGGSGDKKSAGSPDTSGKKPEKKPEKSSPGQDSEPQSKPAATEPPMNNG